MAFDDKKTKRECTIQPEYLLYLLSKTRMMILTIKKGMEKKKLNEALSKIKYSKKFDAKRHLGKVKWGEDALDFQKRLRDEWD